MRVPFRKRPASLICSFVLLSFFSCGKKESVTEKIIQQPVQVQNDQGSYRANLSALNASVSKASGSALMNIIGDEVDAQVFIQGTAAKSKHMQFIYSDGPCPTTANDTNKDGIIDMQEANAITGSVFVPLDDQLNSRFANHQFGAFPESDSSGNYNYSKSASRSQLLAGLGARDLNLNGKTVLVSSVSKSTKSYDADSEEHTVPIACGVLNKIGGGPVSGSNNPSGTYTPIPIPIFIPEPVRIPLPIPVIVPKPELVEIPLPIPIVIPKPERVEVPLPIPIVIPKPERVEVPFPIPVPVPEVVVVCPLKIDFKQALAADLVIIGKKCIGNEVVGDLTCKRGQFVISWETPRPYVPVIVKLIKVIGRPEFCAFDFNPLKLEVEDELLLLKKLQVRFFKDDDPLVVDKTEAFEEEE